MPMTPHITPLQHQRRSGGFTLVEVLVAILVFSVGLLGVAGLLVSVISRNQSSVYHSVAVSLANDIAERMRANDKAVKDPANNKYVTALASGTPGAAVSCVGTGATCTPDGMAQFDASEWEALVRSVLPHGMGIVCFDDSNAADDGTLEDDGSLNSSGCTAGAGSIAIKILWDEKSGRADGTSNTQRYVTVFRP